MPSRYEPCGLNQMYSLRYGTVPIVHRTGGLADTVAAVATRATGTGTGFVFEHHDGAGLRWAIEAALAAYRDRAGVAAAGRRTAWPRTSPGSVQGKLYERALPSASQASA